MKCPHNHRIVLVRNAGPQQEFKHALRCGSCGMSLPEIVCLCGSTRFIDQFHFHYGRLTDEGKIVLTVGRVVPQSEQMLGSARKVMLDELHKRKIDLCDRIFVINVGGYIGPSTRSEIDYAIAHDVPVDYLEPVAP